MTTKSDALARVTLDLADLSNKLTDAENSFASNGSYKYDPTFDQLHKIVAAMEEAVTEAIWELET